MESSVTAAAESQSARPPQDSRIPVSKASAALSLPDLNEINATGHVRDILHLHYVTSLRFPSTRRLIALVRVAI